jgi:biopolymer transport protein ExbB/TolQ
MDIVTNCPQCNVELLVSPETKNGPQVCPRCSHSFIPAIADPALADAPVPRAPRVIRRVSDASVLLGAVLALVPTALVYAICRFGPQNSQFVEIILSGKWVNLVAVYFASWTAMLLLLKRIAWRRQRRALALDLVPRELGEGISSANADRFAGHAEALDARLPGTFAIKRVVKILRFYQSGRSPQEVASNMRAIAEADAQTVESSYTFIKVLIWAIPILGFIGTVLGIGESVHGFSDTMQGAQQLEVIRTSLGAVTTGLAVAFNTTLVALVLSVIVMFPMSALQRADERLLGDIDDYLDEHLLRRLQSDKEEQNRGLDLFRESLAEQAAARQSELADLRASLDTAVREMGKRVLEAWSHVDERLERRERVSQDRAQTLVAAFESSSRALFDELTANAKARTTEAETLIGEMSSVGERIEADAVRTFGVQSDLGRQALLEAQQAILALRERDREEHKEIAEALASSAQELQRVGTELAHETSGSASSVGELVHELSQKLFSEAQQAIASLREKDRDEYREVVRALQGSAQEMERATAALAREAAGSASQIVTAVTELSRKAALESQQAVTQLRDRDRDEQKEVARTIQRAAQEMERATATLAKEASGSTAQLSAMFRQMNTGLEGQAKTLVAGIASQLERQTRELSALQRGLADGMASFQSSLRALEVELGAAIRDARARVEADEQRDQSQVADAWATAQKTIEASARAFESHAANSTASLRQLVEAQQALVAGVSTQFAGALAEHRDALKGSQNRELGAVVKECQNIVAALGRTTAALEKKSERVEARREAPIEPRREAPIEPRREAPIEPRREAPIEPRREAPVELERRAPTAPVNEVNGPNGARENGDVRPTTPPAPAVERAREPERAADKERESHADPASDGDRTPDDKLPPLQSPRTQLPRKALQPRAAKPRPAVTPPVVPDVKPSRTGFWRRFWLGN